MNISSKGLALIKKFEGYRLKSYLCPAGIPTIGYGNTFYSDGRKVSLGETITQEQADKLLNDLVRSFSSNVNKLLKNPVSQDQFDALVSFAYNTGIGNLRKSTLLKKVNINPSDKSIEDEFMKWTKANGKELSGLVSRRKAESTLYFS